MTYLNLLRSKQVPLEFQNDPKKFKKYHKIKYIVCNTFTSVREKGVSITIKKHSYLTVKQVITVLKLLKPELKKIKTSRIYLPLNLDTLLTKKPKDIRMGRGKGAPTEKVYVLKAGKSLLTLYGLGGVEGEIITNLCLPKLDKTININKGKW